MAESKDREGEGEDGAKGQKKTPLWEWVVGVLGLALVAGAIAFMVYQGVAGDQSPPAIALHVEAIQPTTDGYLVMVRAVNVGGVAAAGLVVEGELLDGEESVETSQLTLTFVPSHSERKGGLFFTENPR